LPRARLALCSALLLTTTYLAAQEEEAAPRPAPRMPPVVLHVGTIHPVSGPAIQSGVIVIAGGRIRAIGKADEVEIPDGAERLDYPDAHAYPGLIDAQTTAFADARAVQDGSADAGADVAPALDATDPVGRELAAHGVTTAYVSNRGAAIWRGAGAIVRPTPTGFDPLRLREGTPAGAVHLRLTAGTDRGSHPLDRQKTARAAGDAFRALEAYEKSFRDHAEALKKYATEFDAWLEHHRKANGNAKAEPKPDAPPAEAGERPAGRGTAEGTPGRSRRSGRPGGENRERPTPPAEPPKEGGEPAPAAADGRAKPAEPPASGTAPATAPAAPKRPVYPKPPARDPAKDALLDVKAGKRLLRIEAQRIDELRAALELQKEWQLPRVVVEGAREAAPLAGELAAAGVAVVVDEPLPAPVAPGLPRLDPALAAKLATGGASVAIASGGGRTGRFLPLLAATAAGHGLDPEQAVRAITLTPAEILGIERQTGSLEPGKLADIVVTSGPLLHSDTRILRVLSRGTTVHDAAKER
jgi:imidazolonepropionase-like amidohydrolase